MPEDDATESERLDTIKAVRTPLNMITLFALIVDTILVGSSIATDRIPLWIPLAVLVLIIVLFFITIWAFPENLYPKDPSSQRVPVDVQLGFPIDMMPIDLDDTKTVMTIKPYKGGKERHQTPLVRDSNGSWVLQLSKDQDIMDLIKLEFTETNGRRWRVDYFSLIDRTVAPKLIKQGPGGSP